MTISALAATCGLILFPLAMIYAGLMDLVTLTIRNTLVIGIVLTWAVFAPLAGFSWSDLATSAGVSGAVLAITFTFFALGWIGGGDAKLAAATALWFEPHETLIFFAYASVLGGFLTLGILQLRTGPVPMFFYRLPWIAQLHDPRAGVPYGAAMAPAALIVFPDTQWVAHALS
jgi:prepilin peptidase CpaA